MIAQRERITTPASDTTIYLHGDHLGSVSAATSGSGVVLSRQAFTPWGERRSGGGDITQTTRDFTGQAKDATGLLFYNARYYDPTLGRFLSADTVAPKKASPQTRNRYSYVLNNPLKFIDPNGHCTTKTTNRAESEENEECRKYISWLSGWGLEVDMNMFGNWMSSQLAAVWEGVRRMSDKLGWGLDGRLFQEKVLQGRGPLRVTRFLDDGSSSCGGLGRFGCSSEAELRFSGLALLDTQPDQWAFSQRLVIHELTHVWDFRLKKALQYGLDQVLRSDPSETRDAGARPDPRSDMPTRANVEEDIADSVAYYAVADTPARGQEAFRDSSRWGYVQCVATFSARDCAR